MADLLIKRATLEDARALAPRMRPEEVLEVAASGGHTPLEALVQAVAISEGEAWAALFDGQVACIWGVAPLAHSALGGRRGAVWLLTSDLVERYPKLFWKGCRRELAALFTRWDVLVNAIDVRHSKALRWGARLGFVLEPPAPFGVEGRLFCYFDARREDVHV